MHSDFIAPASMLTGLLPPEAQINGIPWQVAFEQRNTLIHHCQTARFSTVLYCTLATEPSLGQASTNLRGSPEARLSTVIYTMSVWLTSDRYSCKTASVGQSKAARVRQSRSRHFNTSNVWSALPSNKGPYGCVVSAIARNKRGAGDEADIAPIAESDRDEITGATCMPLCSLPA